MTEALGTAPESNCTGVTYNGHDYWFCPSLRSWSTARTKCEAQGYNLVRIEDAAENAFVKGHIGLDSWTGGNDATTEGTWLWTFGGSNFWTGTASGQSMNGLFSHWDSNEPNNLGNQDCAKMVLDGTWRDDSCSLSLRYVCESGTDQCPSDPNKVVPGLCGCGTADADTDADGTPNCQDQCPFDVTKIRPGDCGCSSAPTAAGSLCSDGLCAANTACNGAGVCGNPSSCPVPDTGCTFGMFQNNYYWFCDHDRTFTDGRQRCQSVGMDVTGIEGAAEDTFIESNVSQLDHVFVGGTDEATEGTFVWKATAQQFWSGGPSGSATSGAYANWEQGEPSDGLTGRDCMAKDPPINGGQWEARSCTLAEGYVCEQVDLCPTDPLKRAPGQCNCGNPDTDTDQDGVADCVDPCPSCGSDHTCLAGVCTSCPSGHLDCDRDAATGCETSIGTEASCGTTCANMTVCQQGETCHNGTCKNPTPPNLTGAASCPDDTLGNSAPDTCPGGRLVFSGSPLSASVSGVNMPGNRAGQYTSTCSSGGEDFVWHFVAPLTGTVTATIPASGFNAVVYAETGACGSSGGAVTTLGCSDPGGGPASVTFQVTACTTYFVIADKRSACCIGGTFGITVAYAPGPSGQTCTVGTDCAGGVCSGGKCCPCGSEQSLPPPLDTMPPPPGPVAIVPLTVANVDPFIDAAAASRRSQNSDVAAAIASARGQPGLVDALAQRLPIGMPAVPVGRFLITIKILGELHDAAAFGPLKVLITQPLPPVTPAHATLGDREIIEMIMVRAVQALANLRTSSSTFAVLEFARSHRARAVRVAAGDAYLFVNNDANWAKDILGRYLVSVESPDFKFLLAARKTPETDATAFDERLQAFFAEFPDERPPPPTPAP